MKIKNVLFLSLVFVLVIALVACGGNTNEEKPAAPAEQKTEEKPAEKPAETEAPKDGDSSTTGEAIAEQPVLLTTVGQSADVEMVKAMLENIGLDYSMNNMAKAGDLGEAKTLILAIGGSSKGLGAAGVDADAELERIKSLIDEADEKGLTIIAIHIGGEARRGELSDKFIPDSFKKADYAIVVKAGDSDGLMQGLANDAGIPIDIIENMTDAVTYIKGAFKDVK